MKWIDNTCSSEGDCDALITSISLCSFNGIATQQWVSK